MVMMKTSARIPIKYLNNRSFADFMAFENLSSYFTGTMAIIIFENMFSSRRKKNVMKTTENKPTLKFTKNDASEPKNLVKNSGWRNLLISVHIRDSKDTDGVIDGKSLCISSFICERDPDSMAGTSSSPTVSRRDAILTTRGVMK